jgi:hypothetical protein
MLEKLLRRIALREAPVLGQTPVQPSPQLSGQNSSQLTTLHKTTPLSTGGSPIDPFTAGYPAYGAERLPPTGKTSPGADNPWQVAAQTFMQARETGAPIPDQPAFFADWGVAHLALAQLIWSEHKQMSSGLVHVHSQGKLMASVLPRKRKVLINPKVYAGMEHALTWRQLNALTSASNIDMDSGAAKGFNPVHLHTLMWFYGQTWGGAPSLVPNELGSRRIELRRLPLVEPAALMMRHLALIHLLSGGPLSFAQLQQQVSAEHQSSLCADLASLYLAATLRLVAA